MEGRGFPSPWIVEDTNEAKVMGHAAVLISKHAAQNRSVAPVKARPTPGPQAAFSSMNSRHGFGFVLQNAQSVIHLFSFYIVLVVLCAEAPHWRAMRFVATKAPAHQSCMAPPNDPVLRPCRDKFCLAF